MNIYTIDGSVWLADVPITPSCEAVVELMKEDYVQLVWNADYNDVIPVGSYITYNGERYSLIEPYLPDQRTEKEYTYSPKFVSAYIGLAKVPFFMYTAGGSKEAQWSLTDNPANFMAALCNAILTETGLKYTYAIGNDVVIASATCSFNCTSIQSAINEIANAFGTEIWLEKYAQADANGYIGCLHIGKALYGTAVDLEVGTNIKVPTVTRNGEYFNRFYVFGSARNITQDYQGANVNNLATKRLTLDPTDYPNGYIDFSDGGPVFSKVLQFEDIYPAATDLVVMNIRAWLRYRRDESTSEKIQIGTDPVTGDPVYDQYAVWFVNLKRKVNGSYVDFTFNNTTYDKTDNPTGMLLPGLVPSLHFNSGPLAGREFEVIYHDTEETVKDGNDGLSFNILAGDFEIKFVEEGTYIIPAVTGLIPTTDNLVVLFNVMMPSSYVDDAYGRLEAAALDEIAKNYLDTATLEPVDKNSYQVESDPTVFSVNDPAITVGRKVNYVNGTYAKESRVTKLVTKLDYPCKQTIVFGDEIIKGNIEELKEEAVSANKNIDILTALNKTTAELTAAYERTHQLVLKQLADQSGMFLKEEYERDGETFQRIKLNPIFAGMYADGFLVAGGLGSGGGESGGSLATLADVTLTDVAAGDILRYNATTAHWENGPLDVALSALTDVVIGTPSDGQALLYDSTLGKWKPGNVGGGGSVEVISADATIGTSLTTLATINGTPIKAKIAAYLEISQFTASNIVEALDTTAVNRATADASGNIIKTYYAANLVYASNTLQLKNGNNTTLATITGANILGMLGLNTTDTIATQAWVGNQGYLTSSAISDMATKTWVGQQGYLTASSISDMATKTWVGQQGYLTSSALSGYMLASDYTGNGTSVVNRAKADADGNIIKNYYAANLVVSGTDLLLKNGGNTTLSTITGANIVTVIGNNAVARATADASGNAFSTAYLRKNVDDTMTANLTIGSSSASKTLMVYGSGTFSTSLSVGTDATIGGNATIGAKTTTSTAKSLSVYGRNNSTTPALNIYGVYGNNSAYLSSLYTASDGLHITTGLYVAGNFVATGNSVAGTASDRRLKKGIHTIKNDAVDVLWRLHPVTFEWNDTAGELGGLSGVSAGFIADEFNDIIPNATRKIWDEYDAIDYERVIPYLVAGWKAQQRCIHAMDKEIKELKRRLGDVVQ